MVLRCCKGPPTKQPPLNRTLNRDYNPTQADASMLFKSRPISRVHVMYVMYGMCTIRYVLCVMLCMLRVM